MLLPRLTMMHFVLWKFRFTNLFCAWTFNFPFYRSLWKGLIHILCCIFGQGFEKLRELVDKWEGLPESSARYNLKLFADKETYEAIDELAKIQDKNAHQLAMEIIRNYVAMNQNGKSEA